MNNTVLGLDVGGRRIGVATASQIARLAHAHSFIDRTITTDPFTAISLLVHDMGAETVVVGLPRGLDGQETDQTKATRDFARELEQHIDVPVVLQDEALTSREAEARLMIRKKPYSKGDIDAEAAAMILSDYLESIPRSIG